MGMGLNFRLLKLNSNFRHLAKADLLEAYRASSRRLIFLDYEGTIQSCESMDENTDDLKPQPRLLKLLTALSNDSKNLIFIVSGRQKHTLDQWFSCKITLTQKLLRTYPLPLSMAFSTSLVKRIEKRTSTIVAMMKANGKNYSNSKIGKI
jgi:hypothetical protein